MSRPVETAAHKRSVKAAYAHRQHLKRMADPERREAFNRYQRVHYYKRGRASHLGRRYGITPKQYEDMLIAQGNTCYICKTAKPGLGAFFGVDHDHQTGKVRGLLCNRCNWVLGKVSDSPELLRCMAAYLESTK